MPRTSRVLTGVVFIICICALLLGGCGSNESIEDGASTRTADASAAESSEGEDVEPASTSLAGAAVETSRSAASDDDGLTGDLAAAADSPHETVDTTPAGTPGDTDVLDAATTPPDMDDEELDESSAAEAYYPRTSPGGLSVTRAYICRGIEESEPTDAGRSFLPKEDGLNRLCCFSEIAGAAGPDSIWHVWYWGEREMGRVGLEVKSARWRTWSRKQVLDEWKGEWHVDVVDADGFLLYRLEFSIE